jgi:hypothetical protein
VYPILMTVTAGIFFAIWPMILRTSKLTGTMSSVVLSCGIVISLMPIVLAQGPVAFAEVLWIRVVISCVLGAAGLALYNTALTQVQPVQAATLVVIVNVSQVAAIAIYSIYINSAIASTQIIGFLLAGIAVYLLLK